MRHYYLVLHKGDFTLFREEFSEGDLEVMNEIMVEFNAHEDKIYRLRVDVELR